MGAPVAPFAQSVRRARPAPLRLLDSYVFCVFGSIRAPPGRFARRRRLGPCAAVAVVGGGALVRGAQGGVRVLRGAAWRRRAR
eukprot:1916516-Alexandrium_andersonii.AAC.1